MKNIRETIYYIVFGVLTTLVDYVVAMACFACFGMSELTSNNLAWVVSVIFAYITNKLFVFESKSFQLQVVAREVIAFFGARVLTLLMADVIIWIAVKVHITFFVAKLFSSVIVVVVNYIFSKLFIFKKKKNQEEI